MKERVIACNKLIMPDIQYPEGKLIDKAGREARYVRISITDRCNYNCFYCRDSRRQRNIPHQDILRYEEILKFAKIMQSMGARKFRVTGGEPFARKNCAAFLHDLRAALPDARLCLTSNGSLLEPWLDDLARLRPHSINISLDSFDREAYARITGSASLDAVLKNIERLLSSGARVKLNAVALRGVTDKELDSFLHFVRHTPVDMRFIEFMPMGGATRWTPEMFLPAGELLGLFKEKAELSPAPEADALAGPARMHNIKGAKGRFGFISALSDHFCGRCNRLRLTSDGRLRTCLFSDKEYPLAPLLKGDGALDKARAVIREAAQAKPFGADILKNKKSAAVADKGMSGIGG